MSFEFGIADSGRRFIKRHGAPAVTLYFVRDTIGYPPHRLSCLYCKNTFFDGVTGQIDKVVDGPMPADDHDIALNVQCKQCKQRYRILGAVKNDLQQG